MEKVWDQMDGDYNPQALRDVLSLLHRQHKAEVEQQHFKGYLPSIKEPHQNVFTFVFAHLNAFAHFYRKAFVEVLRVYYGVLLYFQDKMKEFIFDRGEIKI